LDVSLPARAARAPVEGGGDRLAGNRRVHPAAAPERTQAPAIDVEHRGLVDAGDGVAHLQRHHPAVPGRAQAHAAAGGEPVVAHAVLGGGGFERAGRCGYEERRQHEERGGEACGWAHWGPGSQLMDFRRRSISSAPPLRCRIRVGTGSPSTTHSTCSLSPLLRETLVASRCWPPTLTVSVPTTR